MFERQRGKEGKGESVKKKEKEERGGEAFNLF